ncbi:MAG: YeeE/YedE family protein [Gammaproteobacteria bacterium]|nr:MAG: YeeE/YedE family protein [Gammaproteobacteria bacterium]
MLYSYTTPLIGGLLIGLSSVALLFFLGRIAGISGIVWGAISAQPDNSWRWLFLVGLVVGPLLYHQLTATPYPTASPLEWWYALIGGLLVGFGVKLGSGCTSGHGVCGIGNLSPRSLVATITFMAAGITTVYVIRHLLEGL